MADYTWQDYQEMFPESTKELARENCPLQETIALFQGRWTLQVIFELSKVENIRFGALKKKIIGITNTMLTSTLRGLEERMLVNRVQYNEIPPHVEYSLSEAGKDMYPIFIEMANWGMKHLSNEKTTNSPRE